MKPTRLYGYFRSSCSYRVRMALALGEIEYESVPVNLLIRFVMHEEKEGFHRVHREPLILEARQKEPAFVKINPAALVPTLEIGGRFLTQSMAILEYLAESGLVPPLLPKMNRLDTAPKNNSLLLRRQKCREIAHIIGCDTQPVQNLRVLQQVKDWGQDPNAWGRAVVERGFGAVEAKLRNLSQVAAVKREHPFNQPDCPLELRQQKGWWNVNVNE
eukprot:g15709.t1